MTLFFNREHFERSCRHAGISDLAYNDETGEYANAHTQKTFQVWESLAQSKQGTKTPTAWLTRHRGKDQGISVPRPHTNLSPEQWAQRAARGWEQPLALWPAMPVTSASEDAILSERQRQKLVKGYNPELDRRYRNDELLRAAAGYVLQVLVPDYANTLWPWPHYPMKTETRLRAIEKAAALLIAEHERESAQLATEGAA
ncbi:hypothetical protein KVG88_30295 [Pseudomonas sp. SWRI74]|uniref:Uncharacterized protein n=1 Tax=Pseudomonas azerbaijanoccidentalis TaxID=2842347 RepID=A0ABS6R0G0_9PSED|nr:hypothetical protein [Pseudomonas azerbaijanoccidentalis]MBV4524367.1 hypothetical protein [Pseudomonas azerbaijanoccidentalis]